MTDILRLLEGARSGAVSDRQFLGIIHRDLRRGTLDTAALVTALQDESRGRLPGTLRYDALEKIRSWSGDADSDSNGMAWAYEATDTVVNQDVVRSMAAAASHGPAIETWPPDAAAASATTGSFGPAKVGRVLNERFQLIERIGAGGMSTVFKAVDRRRTESQSPDPYVAVKTLNLPEQDYAAALPLLQREAHKLQILAHPNIVRVMDCDRDGPLVFMTMEYLGGESLKLRLLSSSQGLERSEALNILDGIGKALMFAHGNHIVHGDLKPANVLLGAAGQVKVIDFGVARIVSQTQHSQAAAGAGDMIAMTPQYASPEMLAKQPPDPRDDIYALGCIVSELFSGIHPFEGRTASQAREQGLRPIRGARLTGRQFRAVRNALQFDREARTPTVERFLSEFGAVGAGARTGGALRSVGIAAIVLVLLAGLLTWLLRRPDVPATAAPSTAAQPQNGVFRDCPTCPLMKTVPAGKFQQGSDTAAANAVSLETPRHAVMIGAPVAMSVYDVTVAEFREYVDATGHEPSGCWSYDGVWREHTELNWRHTGFDQGPSHPVVCIAWTDAMAYAGWLSERTGQQYRLPSASEWEYAAGAGAAGVSPWAEESALACRDANVADQSAQAQYPGWKVFGCHDGYVFTAPVGSFAPNAFGLYDTLGNVFQWVADCWHDNYDGAPQDGSAWQGGDCSRHEVRGGSWFTDPAFVRTTYRNRFNTDYRTSTVGFRVARVMK
jgi:formylglycine-generating enzyme required for sulfatase activity